MIGLLLVTFSLLVAVHTPAVAQKSRYITVQGTGTVTSVPDMARIVTGVTTRADSARDAVDRNSQAMAALLAVLKKSAIADEDVQTSNFNVSPFYDRYDRNRAREIMGYQATNQVTVTVRKLARLGALLDAVVGAGSNRVSGVQFGIAKPEPLLDQARGSAVADAKRRAVLYAKAAGVTLGAVIRIEERGARLPQPRMFAAEAARSSRPVPVAAGKQSLTVKVQMRFALD
jgi:hypothetical protein